MDKELNITSEIGKVSVYESPTVAQEQIVIDRTIETVIALSGDIVITRGKEAFLNKKSLINKMLMSVSSITRTYIGKNIINKKEVLSG